MDFTDKTKINFRTNSIIGLVLFVVTFVIYFITKPASLSFWDCGEYITCSSILGVPHPPGNPFYIMLGKLFTIIPFGLSDAQAVSLLSIVFSAFTVLFSYLSIVKLVKIWKTEPYLVYITGIIGALFVAFSKEFWVNAIEAEVYGGLSFFLSLIIWLTLVWAEKSRNMENQNLLLLIIFTFFLGFGVHQTTLQIAPAILLIIVLPLIKFNKKFITKAIVLLALSLILYYVFYAIGSGSGRGSWGKYVFAIFTISLLIYYLKDYVELKVWLFALFLIILGLSTHFILPIRASAHPFINEGDPSNWQRFGDYVFRKQYGPTSFFERRAPIMVQLNKHFLRYFSWQFFDADVIGKFIHLPRHFVNLIGQLIVALLGFTGIYYQYKKSKRSFIYLASLFLMGSIAMILVMNLQTAEVRDRPYFFITAYMLWAFWMGIGSIAVIQFFRKKAKILGAIALVIMLMLPLANMASHFHKNDRSQELLALEYGTNFLNGLDKNAIIFTNGDNDTFPLWFSQAVADPNAKEYYLEKDTLIFKEITGKSISKEEKKLSRKTNLLLKQAYDSKKNLEGIRKDVSIANLSLLNTPWYIKQLKKQEGIEINLSDKKIDELRPMKLPQDVVFPVGDIKIKFKEGKILYIKDLMVLQIIKDNYGKRPIYFAVTVADRVGFDKYLQMEGMAERLVETKGKYQIDPIRLNHNINNVFDFNSVYNDKLYKDENMKRLMNNYGANFMSMANVLHEKGEDEDALKYYKKALDFVKAKDKFLPGLSKLYYATKKYDTAFETIAPLLKKNPNDAQINYLATDYLVKADKIDSALTMLDSFIINNPDENYFIQYYFDLCKKDKKYNRGIELMNKLLEVDSKNRLANSYKSQLENLQKD
ncbi:MAG: DUF2723 domain-containing protein [Candidatus Cloacimonadota bacterium]|nr:DUF2723 domain-containing protein [Candidatus Cloacimonadota bacterium]